MTAAPGEVCGVCAAPLRAGAAFCGRCGAEHGRMIPRELGLGVDDAAPRARPRPMSGRGLAVALMVYFAMLLPQVVLLAGQHLPAVSTLDAIEIAGGVIGLIGLLALGRRGLATLVPRRWPLTAAALALVCAAAVLGFVTLMARVLPWMFFETDTLLGTGSLGLAAVLLHVAVIPAVTEEIAFRGAILTGLTDVFSDRTAIIASALVFAIAHLSVPSMVHLTALGLVLGWTRLRTGSIWPGVLIHGLYNTAVVLIERM